MVFWETPSLLWKHIRYSPALLLVCANLPSEATLLEYTAVPIASLTVTLTRPSAGLMLKSPINSSPCNTSSLQQHRQQRRTGARQRTRQRGRHTTTRGRGARDDVTQRYNGSTIAILSEQSFRSLWRSAPLCCAAGVRRGRCLCLPRLRWSGLAWCPCDAAVRSRR